MKKIKITVCALLLGFVGITVHAQTPAINEAVQKFNSVLFDIDNYYVDSTKTKKLVADAISGMLETLDPHSVYIPKEDLEETNEPLNGNLKLPFRTSFAS